MYGSFSGLNYKFNVGRVNATGTAYSQWANACIKEVSIWSGAKTASDIENNYEDYIGYTGSETNLKGYWKVNDGTGSTYDDLTTSNNNLITTNTTSSTPVVFTWSSDVMVDYFTADVESYSDYYPFGMMMPGRNGSPADYEYGFNGMRKDDEIKGSNNSYDFGARIYGPRLGRFLSRDPKEQEYAGHSPYVAFNNNPIFYIDPDGAAWIPPGSVGTVNDMGELKTQSVKSVFKDMRRIPIAYHGETYKYTSQNKEFEYYFVFDANVSNSWQLYTYYVDDGTFQKGINVYGALTVEGPRRVASEEKGYVREEIYDKNMWNDSEVQKTPEYVMEHVADIMSDVKAENIGYEEIKIVEIQVKLNPEMPDYAVALVKEELAKNYGPEVNIVVIKEPKPASDFLSDPNSGGEVNIGGSNEGSAETGSTGEWDVNSSEKITVVYETKLKAAANP